MSVVDMLATAHPYYDLPLLAASFLWMDACITFLISR